MYKISINLTARRFFILAQSYDSSTTEISLTIPKGLKLLAGGPDGSPYWPCTNNKSKEYHDIYK
jgi:hypothetical protein